MVTIHLHQLRFFCFHGIHQEERLIGNEFIVNIDIDFDPAEIIRELDETINYVTVYELVKKRMLIATPLLETIGQELLASISELDTRIRKLQIRIEKSNPPIEGFEGTVGVTCTKQY